MNNEVQKDQILQKEKMVRILKRWEVNFPRTMSIEKLKNLIADVLPDHQIDHYNYSRDEMEVIALLLNLNPKRRVREVSSQINSKLKEIKLERSTTSTLLLISTLKEYVRVCNSEITSSSIKIKDVVEKLLRKIGIDFKEFIEWEMVDITRETLSPQDSEKFDVGIEFVRGLRKCVKD